MTLTGTEFQKGNFFRSPSWRWDRVVSLVDRPSVPGRCTRQDDEFIRRGKTFYLQLRGNRSRDRRRLLFREEPGLYYAIDFHRRQIEDPESALLLQARILTAETDENIAKTIGLTPDTVCWYERMFFNVRDRLIYKDWIVRQVIMPALMRHPAMQSGKDQVVNPSHLYDGTLKLFAYFGGPHAADIMISGFQSGRKLMEPDKWQTWFDEQWAMTFRKRMASASPVFEVNRYNITELFGVYTRLLEIEKKAASGQTPQNVQEQAANTLLAELPWAFGAEAAKRYADTEIGRQDQEAEELRDDELLTAARGEKVAVEKLGDEFPAPKKKLESIAAGIGDI